MIRALYTAASGMRNAQQTNIDNVAHNLANVNTTGFKKSRVEFGSRLSGDSCGWRVGVCDLPAPIGLEMGLGTRGHGRNFSAGNLLRPATRWTSRSKAMAKA